MKHEIITKRIKDIVCEYLCIDKDSVNLNQSIYYDLGADSLDIVELVMLIEDEFDINIPNKMIQQDMKIINIVELVENCIEDKLNNITCDTCRYWYQGLCIGCGENRLIDGKNQVCSSYEIKEGNE